MSFRDPSLEQNEKFALYDDELTKIENDIQKLIVEIKQTDDEEDRVDKIKKAKKLLEQSKKTYQNLSNVVKKETREHSRDMMTKNKDEHKNMLNKFKTYLSQAVSDLKDEEEKKKRLDETPTTPNPENQPRKSEPIRMENDNFIEKQQLTPEQQIQVEKELFKDVFQAHQDSLDIIERLNIKILDTTEIAIDSVQLLREQREDLMEIEREVDSLGGEIQRGAREIGSIMKRLTGDKFLLLGSIALVVGILIAIVALIGLIVYNRVRTLINPK